jgi:hypothetical protein
MTFLNCKLIGKEDLKDGKKCRQVLVTSRVSQKEPQKFGILELTLYLHFYRPQLRLPKLKNMWKILA